MKAVVLDAGALIAADRNDARIRGLQKRWLGADIAIYVPLAVLAQVWRSDRQVLLSRFVADCEASVMRFEEARAVGRMLAAAGTADVVDAAVVVAARELRPIAVVTSDRRDLEQLAKAVGMSLPIVDV
jgi:rRNA-processing protein FCF1